ncbi:hypothetical protein Dimus_028384 [Dionaea muscipula]
MTTGNYPDTSSSTNTATAYNDDDDDDDDKPERGLSHVPQRYVLNPLHRSVSDPQAADVPVVDLADLHKGPAQRSTVIQGIKNACLHHGFFQVVNHGICQSVLDGVMESAKGFFELPEEEKLKYISKDVHKPVRCGTSLKDQADKVQFWRVFLKHYAHPVSQWIDLWPNDPPNYRKNMGEYSAEVMNLAIELMEAITESLGLGPNYLGKEMEEGMQVIILNCYPPCPDPRLALGLPPHSDYSCFTILLQSSQGLEIKDFLDGEWKVVPHKVDGSLQVHIGDHLEVLSNGIYRSLIHRATLNSEKNRISIASLHSMGLEKKMVTAAELVDEQHPRGYRESSFKDFLNFLATVDGSEGKSFLDSLKITN